MAAFWLVSTARAATETPEYKGIRADGNIEIRDYPALTLAGTAMDGSDMNSGFRQFFRFITGTNETSEKIEMTTPVLIGSESGKKTMSIAIHWFRRDLRIADNTALNAALAAHERVVPVFITSEWTGTHHCCGAPRQAFLCGSRGFSTGRFFSTAQSALSLRKTEPPGSRRICGTAFARFAKCCATAAVRARRRRPSRKRKPWISLSTN
ncbi:MAG: heme-binding protein [Verrucomicrobia bacterium]|nr:heme-binding protein [Verrucomicrobiota bacterium]